MTYPAGLHVRRVPALRRKEEGGEGREKREEREKRASSKNRMMDERMMIQANFIISAMHLLK